MTYRIVFVLCLGVLSVLPFGIAAAQPEIVPAVPSLKELNAAFSDADEKNFQSPQKVFYPETLCFYLGGNVSKEGITADIEAIAGAGISGVLLFHGAMGGNWSKISEPIPCLSPLWDDAIRHTAEECRRLGLRLTIHNCPGWAMSGGPWIKPENAMRHLVFSRTDIERGKTQKIILPKPQPSHEYWRDYKEIAVIAFPTPIDDTATPLTPQNVEGNGNIAWNDCLSNKAISLTPTTNEQPYWFETTFQNPVTIRTIEFSPVQQFNHNWCYEPGVTVTVEAIFPNGTSQKILQAKMPQSSWQDDRPISLACDEVFGVSKYRVSIVNQHDMRLNFIHLYSSSRKNNWESEAAWTLRNIVRESETPKQSAETFVKQEQIIDITPSMTQDGNLNWLPPENAEKWTILRIGHVNTGMKNSPAPPEGTGWECDKLSTNGADAHFPGFIGRLTDSNGALGNGFLRGVHLDSWECKTQTWTNNMETEFEQRSGYPLRKWLPAVFGFVLNDHETTSRFLRDWRGTIGDLFANKFYGRMAEHAHEKKMPVSFETAAGDIFPADILEFQKHADVPMTEFWQPYSDNFVGSINFKPIKPTVSAARLYGKPRIAAESFTSFSLTWDEHLSMLKEIANLNCAEGVTHLMFHTYTHNPQKNYLPPGTSFGGAIGTPFLRGQTWWKDMPEFTTYLSRLNYLFERGKPVSDVLWYLGDEINHKPDQKIEIKGYKYDYCNPDILLNRLSVKDGKIVTPEGIRYCVLWIPENKRMLPETLEKLVEFAKAGATIVGNEPKSLATLKEEEKSQKRFDTTVKELWTKEKIYNLGKGRVISHTTIDEALKLLNIPPDVTFSQDNDNALWLHRQTENADWYFVAAPFGTGFSGDLSFRQDNNNAEIWNPVTGEITAANVIAKENGRTVIHLDLTRAESCFIVFRRDKKQTLSFAKKQIKETLPLNNSWSLSFPDGWNAPQSLTLDKLQAWKDLDVSPEAKAFSGTATYTTTFDIKEIQPNTTYILDFGKVEMLAEVILNSKKLRTLWAEPYRLDITTALKPGKNNLKINVTSTWFNRLVYDAGLPESERKTWTIAAPKKDKPLRESGLLGPVRIEVLR